jgi:predicted nucleic acid-binding protein
VDAFAGPRRTLPAQNDAVAAGDVLTFSAVVFYEWLRGPRTDEERSIVDSEFEAARVVAFGTREARVAADLFRRVPGARRRQADLAIAACAIEHGAALWTLNPADFDDIPTLSLYRR